MKYPTTSYQDNSSYIKIDNNYFYDDYIDLNINSRDLKISGFLYYSDITYNKNNNSHSIIKIFNKYLANKDPVNIISYHHYIDGVITFNNYEIDFEDGIGYIGDHLDSLIDYTFIQSNILFKDLLEYRKISFIMYINDTPKKLVLSRFKAILLINEQEYYFSNLSGYSMTKITKNNNICQYIIKNKKYKLIVKVKPLIKQSNNQYINSIIHITLIKNNKIIFKQKLINSLYEKKITTSNPL